MPFLGAKTGFFYVKQRKESQQKNRNKKKKNKKIKIKGGFRAK